MKKLIMGGLFAVLFSLTAGVTTVYAEDTETSGTISEMESVEEIVDETTTEESSEVDNSVDETITSEENSVYEEEEVTEESPLQVWFNENVMPWLGTAIAAAGGTGAVTAILALLIKWIIQKIESKLKEAYEKKAEADKQEQDYNEVMSSFTNSLNATMVMMKEIFEQKGDAVDTATKAFAEKYDELAKELGNMQEIVCRVTDSNVALSNTVVAENLKMQDAITASQSATGKMVAEDMKLLEEILIIAFTNMPYLVSNGYATKIKEVVKEHEQKK
jgi:hypothetical protein